jgi:histidyl-tRNA synthetase
VNLPALGFGMGDVVLLELLKERQKLPRFDSHIDAVCVIEDESLRPDSLKLIQELRVAGLAVDYALTPTKPDKQFKRAQELGAAFVVRLERVSTGELIVKSRDLRTRQEQTMALAEAPQRLKQGGA